MSFCWSDVTLRVKAGEIQISQQISERSNIIWFIIISTQHVCTTSRTGNLNIIAVITKVTCVFLIYRSHADQMDGNQTGYQKITVKARYLADAFIQSHVQSTYSDRETNPSKPKAATLTTAPPCHKHTTRLSKGHSILRRISMTESPRLVMVTARTRTRLMTFWSSWRRGQIGSSRKMSAAFIADEKSPRIFTSGLMFICEDRRKHISKKKTLYSIFKGAIHRSYELIIIGL